MAEVYRPLVLAHRGNGSDAPQNTLSALFSDSSYQSDGIECDLWKCGSGQIVITHDPQIEKHSDGHSLVYQKDYEELKNYNFAKNSNWGEFERLPTLIEILDQAHKFKVINLEIKTHQLRNYGIIKKLKAVLDLFPSPEKLILSSFDLKTLLELKRHLPNIRRGFLIHSRQLPSLSMGFVHSWVKPYSWHVPETYLSPKVVKSARKRGVKIFAWTVNSLEFFEKCVKYRVEGIITDRPSWIRERLKENKP